MATGASGANGLPPRTGPTDDALGSVYSDDILAREAALAGQGVALARKPYARDDLDRGRLVPLFDAWLAGGATGWSVRSTPVFARSVPALFRDWLLVAISDDDALG